MPDTSANEEFFARPGVSKGEQAGFPQARLVAVAECGTHAVIDADVRPQGSPPPEHHWPSGGGSSPCPLDKPPRISGNRRFLTWAAINIVSIALILLVINVREWEPGPDMELAVMSAAIAIAGTVVDYAAGWRSIYFVDSVPTDSVIL